MADDDTRSLILAAALELLREQGQHALTVRAVATRAGCSTIGVYTWFGSKDGLIDAILAEGFAGFGDALATAPRPAGPLGRIRGQAMAYRTWALGHPAHYQVMFARQDPSHTPSNEAGAAALRAYEELHAGVMEARTRGELRTDDVEAVALTCWGLAHGLVSLELANPKPPELADQPDMDLRAFALAVDVLARGLAPAKPAPRATTPGRRTPAARATDARRTGAP